MIVLGRVQLNKLMLTDPSNLEVCFVCCRKKPGLKSVKKGAIMMIFDNSHKKTNESRILENDNNKFGGGNS